MIPYCQGLPTWRRTTLIFSNSATANQKAADEELKTTRDRLYPSTPSPPIKPPLPLEKYVGKYHDAGYGTLEIKLNCSELDYPKDSPASTTTEKDGCRLVARPESQPGMEGFAVQMDLEHISGDFWLGWAFAINFKYRRPQGGQRIEFRLDASGAVASVGVDVRLEGESVPLTLFTRVAD